MKYWYSASKQGFFNDAFYGVHQLPHDIVELTEDEYLYLIHQNHHGLELSHKEGKPIIVTNRN